MMLPSVADILQHGSNAYLCPKITINFWSIIICYSCWFLYHLRHSTFVCFLIQVPIICSLWS